MTSKSLPIAIVIVALVVSATTALLYRWQIVPSGGTDNGAYRLDRLTGAVAYCVQENCRGIEPTPDYLSEFLKAADRKK